MKNKIDANQPWMPSYWVASESGVIVAIALLDVGSRRTYCAKKVNAAILRAMHNAR